jgi:hypothetical protein
MNISIRLCSLTIRCRDRAFCLGYSLYVTGQAPIELIDHHKFEKDEMWTRKEMYSNIPRWRAMKDLLFLDEIPLQVPLNTVLMMVASMMII